MPTNDIQERINPFKTLERLSLHELDLEAISFFGAWMLAASRQRMYSNPSLNLTHFHCQTHAWQRMDDLAVFDLLEALRLSPNLQVLVLRGLACAGLEVIGRIADACPNLSGLTLISNYDNEGLDNNHGDSWPHTSSEYASRFSAFSSLHYFCWNYPLPTILDPTPSITNQVENGVPDRSPDEGPQEQENMGRAAYLASARLMAVPFATHCPSLKNFAIEGSRLDFQIDRTPEGKINLSPVGMLDMINSSGMWHTVPGGDWPPITSPTATQSSSLAIGELDSCDQMLSTS